MKTTRRDPVLPIDFEALGIDPSEIRKVVALRDKPSHLVYRLECTFGNKVLKWFRSSQVSIELQTYVLLERHGVETIPVYKRAGQVLLLEDLQYSPSWRLANPEDMEKAETGKAVAVWYRSLHRAGRGALLAPDQPAAFLTNWVSEITPEDLRKAGEKFELKDYTGFIMALDQLECLKESYLLLPQTFNYDDFDAENLALSRGADSTLRAVVFDYDCFALGAVYSDYRNVMYSLQGAARAAFAEAYGSTSPREKALDDPLAILQGLVVASQRSRTPGWAVQLIETVRSGELQKFIEKAKEVY